jgi:hypothetical protein
VADRKNIQENFPRINFTFFTLSLSFGEGLRVRFFLPLLWRGTKGEVI